MEINQSAPLVARHSVTISAPPATVWVLLSEIDAWPTWHAGITKAHREGPLAIGTTFRWTSGGTAIVSTIQVLEPGQRLGWTGRALGTMTEHLWSVAAAEGGTVVTTAESMSGWLIQVLKLVAPRFLDDALLAWLAALRRRAEAAG